MTVSWISLPPETLNVIVLMIVYQYLKEECTGKPLPCPALLPCSVLFCFVPFYVCYSSLVPTYYFGIRGKLNHCAGCYSTLMGPVWISETNGRSYYTNACQVSNYKYKLFMIGLSATQHQQSVVNSDDPW